MENLEKTLHVTTQGMYLRLEVDALRAEKEDGTIVRVPIRQLGAVYLYGRVGLSTDALHRLAQESIPVVWFSRSGRYVARTAGPVSGNVLLRWAQFEAAGDSRRSCEIAKPIVAAKLLNSRTVLLDAAKDSDTKAGTMREVAAQLALLVESLPRAADLDTIRGLEGQGARLYLSSIGRLSKQAEFQFAFRSRRPALDRMNALLSFLYAMVRVRCVAALEAIGLDSQVGFLHAMRPGRESLGLDLMEEFRSPFADRFALTLVNRRQLGPADFVERPGGAFEMTDSGRSTVLKTWDEFMAASVPHRAFDRSVERRFVPHVQAMLLARHLRGDLHAYLPFRTMGR